MSFSASSLFVANRCMLEDETLVRHVSWSQADPVGAIMASTFDKNDREIHQVLFINNEGGLLKNSSVTHTHEATVLSWQPNSRILAIGWGDGMISCWSVDGRIRPSSTFSNTSQHMSNIKVLEWNPAGKRLVSGDGNGLVVVWAVDARGTLTPTRQYRKKGEIMSITFCHLTMKADGPRKPAIESSFSPSFFFGTSRGGLVYADDLGNCADVHQLSSSVDTLMFFQEASRLVIITRSLMLIQYQVSDDGKVSRISQVKLSVAGDIVEKGLRSVVWAGPGILAAACHEKMVRLFDIAADETYNISLSALGDMVERGDRVVAVAFSPIDRYLAIGTKGGVIAIWKFTGQPRDVSLKGGHIATPTSQGDWVLHHKAILKSSVTKLEWGGGQGTLAVVTEDGCVVLGENTLHNSIDGDLAILQTDTHEVSVFIKGDSWAEKPGILISGIASAQTCFVIWSGKRARVYRYDPQLRRCEAMETFETPTKCIAIADSTHLADESLFVADAQVVRVLTFAGTQKGSVSFSEAEGNPTHLDIKGRYLAIMTDRNIVKVMDVHTPTKPKPVGSAGKFEVEAIGVSPTGVTPHADTPAFGAYFSFFPNVPVTSTASKPTMQVRCVKVNCDGSRVAILADRVEGALRVRHPDSRLHVYDRSKGGVNSYDFESQGRCPVSVFWDAHDDRLLCVEAVKTGSSASKESGANGFNSRVSGDSSENEVEIVMFFATSDHGILLQDSFPKKMPFGSLIGIECPNIYFRSAPPPIGEDGLPVRSPVADLKVCTKVMRDFVGLETEVDDESRLALLEFSFNLTLGRLDDAYRAVKTVDSPSIWENMAQMCVKTRRLDVAEICLGHMGHARAASALRDAKNEGCSNEACIGILAIHLGLLDDAAKLFREAKRSDLLNRLYQSAGLWEKAIDVASANDRIHLKTTHFHYAKHLESIGNVDGAIKNYELSETSRNEIPRMLYTLGLMGDLEDYVHRSADKDLLKWWAAYLESKGKYDKARRYYSKANDFLSLVRISCFKGDFATAAEIVGETQDKAAAYHFARQLELKGEVSQAIQYYASSGCYNQAIRIARANDLDTDLMRFALKSTSSLMLDCAAHFEAKGDMDKAIQLYHKGGDLAYALDLCFRSAGSSGKSKSQQSQAIFDMLNNIAADLGTNTSPQTLARCAEFLVQHKQYERAADLYIMAKRIPQAIDMCFTYKVDISEEMLDKLTPPDTADPQEKKEALKDLAKALKRQGSYLLASKKYTQAGDRVRAIKCLVRSGDTKAVIQFASISRTSEIYKLAANYLQQMNWRESAEIMKAIITFYTKAKAYEQLAGFYDSCAQVEIDEYRDYEKAHGALREAVKQLGKAEDNGGGYIGQMTQEMNHRISLIDRFVQARKASKREPLVMVSICEALLKEGNLEEAIRVGDCLAMLVEHYHSAGNMKEAYKNMQDMEGRGIALHPYIDGSILNEVCAAMGVKSAPSSPEFKPKASGNHSATKYDSKHGDDEDLAEMDEEIGEDLDDDDEQKEQAKPQWGRGYAAPRK